MSNLEVLECSCGDLQDCFYFNSILFACCAATPCCAPCKTARATDRAAQLSLRMHLLRPMPLCFSYTSVPVFLLHSTPLSGPPSVLSLLPCRPSSVPTGVYYVDKFSLGLTAGVYGRSYGTNARRRRCEPQRH